MASHQDEYLFAASTARSVYRNIARAPAGPIGAATLLMLRAHHSREDVEAFWSDVQTDTESVGNALRRWLIATAGAREKTPPVVTMFVVMKAMAAWVEGRHVRTMVWRQSEGIPQIPSGEVADEVPPVTRVG